MAVIDTTQSAQDSSAAAGDRPALRVETLEESFDILAPSVAKIVKTMYTRLFELSPRIVEIFKGHDPRKQLRTVMVLRDSFDDLSEITPELEALGARHASWGVEEQDYALMGPVLLESMAMATAPYWRSEYTAAWAELFEVVQVVMLRGAEKAHATS